MAIKLFLEKADGQRDREIKQKDRQKDKQMETHKYQPTYRLTNQKTDIRKNEIRGWKRQCLVIQS